MPELELALPKLRGLQKVAIFLIALGSADSAAILQKLPEEDADRIAKAVARLEHVAPEQVELVLEEYHQYSTSRKLLVRGESTTRIRCWRKPSEKRRRRG